jgi:tetratricopeptide (TPR) repeat protein
MYLKKGVITLLALIIVHWTVDAQQTMVYKDVNLAYKKGIDFYQKGLYSAAQVEFKKVIESSRPAHQEKANTMVQSAGMYYALSALKLERPEGEQLVLDFIHQYAPNSIANAAQFEIGKYYYAKKDYEKTIKYLSATKTLSLTNDEIVERSFKLGYAYFVTKRFKEAKEELYKVKEIENSPFYESSNYYYGVLEFFDGEYKSALASFKRVENSPQYQHIIPYYICQLYFAQGQYDELLTYGVNKLENPNIKNRKEINQMIGQAYFERKDYAKALPYLEEFANNSSKLREEDLYQVGYTQYRNGKYKEAIRNFQELAGLNNKIGQNALYNLADCHLKAGDKLSARNAFKAVSQLNFDEVIREESQFNYAKLSYDLKDDKEAIAGLKAVPPSSSNYAEAQELLSKVFLRTNNYVDAIATLEGIPNKSNNLREAYQKVTYARGVQLFNDGDLNGARAAFAKSLQNPIHGKTRALTYYWLGEIDHLDKDYDGSIQNINQYLTIASSIGGLPDESSEYTANYTQGYNYLKKEDYISAQRYFYSSIKGIEDNGARIFNDYVKIQVLGDAILRNADCFFKRNKYSEAMINYNKVISSNLSGIDYALFQKGIIEGLSTNSLGKVVTLDKLVKTYPNSPFADDALLELGNTYFALNKPYEANQALNQLINNYKGKSDLVNQGLLQLGLIAYNTNETEKALNYYKQVFTSSPYSKEAKEALKGIEEIYIDKGEADKYFAFLNSVPGYQVNDATRDSLTFRTAEAQYRTGDYDKAIASYSVYISKFPNGANIISAYYQRAESYFTKKDYPNALADYIYIADKVPNAFQARAARKAGYIAENFTKEYEKAYTYFKKLESYSSDPDDVYTAQLGSMRGAFHTKKNAELEAIAGKIFSNPRAIARDKAEANFYLGKMTLEAKNWTKAEQYFKQVKLLINNIWAAEAHYQLAYILYQKRDLQKAQDLALDFSAQYPDYIDWYARSIILLADIFAEQNDLFNAKASLESVIDNYEGDQSIINLAKEKLEKIKKLEQGRSRIENGGGNGNLQMDDGSK